MSDENKKQEHEEAYAKGREDASNDGLIGAIFHVLGEAITSTTGTSEEHESYKAGYEDELNDQ